MVYVVRAGRGLRAHRRRLDTNPTLASLCVVNRVVLFRRRHNRLQSAAYFAVVVVGEGIRSAAGRRTSRASSMALLQPSRRVRELAN